jgi:hypothetical protein
MKKKTRAIVIIAAAFVIGVILLFLWFNKGGDIKDVNRTISQSEVYSELDIANAMDVVEKKFRSDFDGCKLTDLWYDENASASSSVEWAAQYHAGEAILLMSNFDVNTSVGNGSRNPNSTYTDWQWILVCDKDNNKWNLKPGDMDNFS